MTPLANPQYSFDSMAMQFIPLFLISDCLQTIFKHHIAGKQYFEDLVSQSSSQFGLWSLLKTSLNSSVSYN